MPSNALYRDTAVMVLSRLFLHAHYTSKHLMGVVLCLGGLALTIVSDLNKHTPNADYPQALRGDILCILGAALYAGSNVMQEDFVKNHNRVSESYACALVYQCCYFFSVGGGVGNALGCLNHCTWPGRKK